MDKQELIKIVIKVLIYALSLVAAYFGVTSLASCAVERDVDIRGKATIYMTDTTYVEHQGKFELKTK